MTSKRQALAYVGLTVAFWSLVWGTGGEATTDHGVVRVGASGAVLNFALLPAALRGSRWANYVLVAEAVFLGLGIGSVGFPPFGPSFGLLAIFPAGQAVLLVSIGRSGGAGEAEGPTPFSQ